jgi:hypothetical protein
MLYFEIIVPGKHRAAAGGREAGGSGHPRAGIPGGVVGIDPCVDPGQTRRSAPTRDTTTDKAQADAIEAAVSIVRLRADAKRVDQAILARAFRGEL